MSEDHKRMTDSDGRPNRQFYIIHTQGEFHPRSEPSRHRFYICEPPCLGILALCCSSRSCHLGAEASSRIHCEASDPPAQFQSQLKHSM